MCVNALATHETRHVHSELPKPIMQQTGKFQRPGDNQEVPKEVQADECGKHQQFLYSMRILLQELLQLPQRSCDTFTHEQQQGLPRVTVAWGFFRLSMSYILAFTIRKGLHSITVTM